MGKSKSAVVLALAATVAVLIVAPVPARGAARQTGGAAYPEEPSVPAVKGKTGGASAPTRKPRSRPRRARDTGHRFPVAGPYSFGDAGARFGAPRGGGRSHRGQDMPAAKGTPVVAVTSGRISERGYDPQGAGYYLVLDARDEDYDYVYMHLEENSLLVVKGQAVRVGAVIGAVGNTGQSFGAHLHFEAWRGAWFAGGTAVDPLPLLRSWRPA